VELKELPHHPGEEKGPSGGKHPQVGQGDPPVMEWGLFQRELKQGAPALRSNEVVAEGLLLVGGHKDQLGVQEAVQGKIRRSAVEVGVEAALMVEDDIASDISPLDVVGVPEEGGQERRITGLNQILHILICPEFHLKVGEHPQPFLVARLHGVGGEVSVLPGLMQDSGDSLLQDAALRSWRVSMGKVCDPRNSLNVNGETEDALVEKEAGEDSRHQEHWEKPFPLGKHP